MRLVRNDPVQVLEYLKRSVERMREITRANPAKWGSEMLKVADQIAADAERLEAELRAAGYIPANEP